MIWAIIITIPAIIVFYLFIYYGIYRDKLYKNLKIKGQTSIGKVIKTTGFVFKLVKVEYLDLQNITRQKWHSFLFSMRNARLLKEKENIRILIYKNKFGVDEVLEFKKND